MTKMLYLAAMALLGLGMTMAQSTTPTSDPSNSSKPAQTQNGAASNSGAADSSQTTGKPSARHQHQANRRQDKVPDPTVRDQQSSTTSTTGASGQNSGTPSTSNMGTAGSNPEPENTPPANRTGEQPGGEPTDQQPNSSSPPSQPHLVMNSTPGARAAATHSPDPGTCMNPASLQTSEAGGTTMPSSNPNCD